MINRVASPRKVDTMRPGSRYEINGAIVGGVCGLVVGAVAVFAVNTTARTGDPLPGANQTQCGVAAERFAQLDATWRDLTLSGTRALPMDGARVDGMPLARGEALMALDACRAAGQ
jgi:hypothetical protein